MGCKLYLGLASFHHSGVTKRLENGSVGGELPVSENVLDPGPAPADSLERAMSKQSCTGMGSIKDGASVVQLRAA